MMWRCAGLVLIMGCGPMPEPDPVPDAGARVELAEPVTVERFIDGDTLEVRRQGRVFRVRLKGLNTPEMNFDEPSAEPDAFAQEALDYAAGRAGIQVGLEWDSLCTEPFGSCQEGRDGQACFDRYCRMLAHVRLSDGSDLGEALLEEGLARVYRFNNEMFDRLGAYLNAEDLARQNRLGLWQ
jgi:endonuclease YncB( thermonuclease family)